MASKLGLLLLGSFALTGQMIAYIENNKRPGESVTVTVVRDGQHIDVSVTLGERPQRR